MRTGIRAYSSLSRKIKEHLLKNLISALVKILHSVIVVGLREFVPPR